MKPVPSAQFAAVAVEASPRAGGASLDLLRFAAAGFILLFHYGATAPISLDHMFPVFQQGWLATDFFLLLSGYVLSRAYGERLVTSHMRRTHFFLKRFARLWPSHIIVLLAFGVFFLISDGMGFLPKHLDRYGGLAFFAQAFLVHGWGMLAAPGWNIPTWTLSALLVCYALFSAYVPMLYNRSLAVMAAMAAVVLVLAHILASQLAHHPFVDLPFEWGLLRAIPLFLLGNLVERMTAGWRVGHRAFWLSLIGVATAIAGLLLWPRNAVIDSLILGMLALALAVSGAASFTESALTRRLGRASFALFLVHSLVGAIWFSLVAKLVARFGLALSVQWGLWAMGVALAVAAAFAFDAFVDKPLSARISRLSFVRGGV